MKVRMNRQELVEALGAVGNVAAARTPKPILQCVRIDAEADHCLLAATDLEIGIRFTVSQVEVEEKGTVVVLADKLSQIVRESTDEVVELELDDTMCHVRGEGAHFQIYAQDPSEFPPVAQFDGEPDVKIEPDVLRRMTEWTVFAAARENTRYAINGVLWKHDGNDLTLVATDGRRMSVAKQKTLAKGPTFESIIPVKAMQVFLRILGDADKPIEVKLNGNQMLVRSPRATVSTGLVEGQFPDYEKVIPADNTKKVVFKRDAFFSGVKRAALLTNEESKGVRFAFKKGQVTLSSRAPSQGEATIDLPVEYDDGELVIGFNPVFVVDVLRVVDEDQVTLELKEGNYPGVIRNGKDFRYVIMPVNLS